MKRNKRDFEGMRVNFMNSRPEPVSTEDKKDAEQLAKAKFNYFNFDGEEEQVLPDDSLLQQVPKFKLGKEIKMSKARN